MPQNRHDLHLPPHPASYIERLLRSPDMPHKIDLAAHVAQHLISPSDRVFVASGTTAAVTGLEILCKRPEVMVHTHSVPMAWHFMEFMFRKQVDASAKVEIVSGTVDATTGIIQNSRIGKVASNVFLYAPHGIGVEGISGNRDVVYLQAAWKAHPRVLVLATHSKLLRTGGTIVKYMGHIKKEAANGVRICELVIPENPLKTLEAKDRTHIKQVLDALEDAGVVISRAPRCKHSAWTEYFEQQNLGGRTKNA